jgi:hypothetical protein
MRAFTQEVHKKNKLHPDYVSLRQDCRSGSFIFLSLSDVCKSTNRGPHFFFNKPCIIRDCCPNHPESTFLIYLTVTILLPLKWESC